MRAYMGHINEALAGVTATANAALTETRVLSSRMDTVDKTLQRIEATLKDTNATFAKSQMQTDARVRHLENLRWWIGGAISAVGMAVGAHLKGWIE